MAVVVALEVSDIDKPGVMNGSVALVCGKREPESEREGGCCSRERERESGQNSQIPLFIEIYINVPMLQKYLGIYHFLGAQVWGTRVL